MVIRQLKGTNPQQKAYIVSAGQEDGKKNDIKIHWNTGRAEV